MTTFSIFKDGEGTWRWVGTYTNSLMDNDLPPDIITSAAHHTAIDKMDSGEYPLPELYIWHERAWKIGQAELVVMDEVQESVVFLTAVGTIDADKAAVAELLAERPCTMSQGIYVYALEDVGDHRNITDYKTVEVSVLPAGIALPANPYTYFTTLEDSTMSINPTKRDRLMSLLPEALVNAIEGSNKALAEKALDEGVQFKAGGEGLFEAVVEGEVAPEAEAVAEPEAEVAPEPEAEAVAEPEAEVAPELELEAPVTEPVVATLSNDDLSALSEVFEAIGKGLGLLQDAVVAIDGRLKALDGRFDALEAGVEKAAVDAALPLSTTAIDRFLKAVSNESTPAKAEKSVPPAQAAARAYGGANLFETIVGGNHTS